MSIAAYKRTIRESENPRQIERRVMSRITGDLERYAQDFDTTQDKAVRLSILAGGLRATLAENQSLWSALRHDLAQSENALPPNLRAQLISISLWVDRQSTAVMGGAAGVGALAVINRSIVEGLAGRAPEPAGL